MVEIVAKVRQGMQRWWLVGFLVAVSLLAGACGFLSQGGSNDGGNKKKSSSSGPAAASTLDQVEEATIYIEAAGGFNDVGRQLGGDTPFGRGSGFIIDPSGLAVTNNHVVTGSGYLDVYVEGEEEPLGAKILGASECSDLALIDIDSGGYSFLEWRDGNIQEGLHVTATGFPANDVPGDEKPDYTVVDGIINSTEAEGLTDTSAVEEVLEHSAEIRPGNSGGPLLDDDHKVVGINYGGALTESGELTGPYLAISRDEAKQLVDQLKMGDVDSLGVNGVAIPEEEGIPGGIFVYSIKTGSPASDAGIKSATVNEETGEFKTFDFITELEGTDLAKEGTMDEYCKILRGRTSPDQPLRVQVARLEESGDVTILEGEINGKPLKPVESATVETESTTESDDTADAGYTTVKDETGALTMEVPTDWSDGARGSWVQEGLLDGQELGPQITATPDLQSFTDTWNTPGVFFGASSLLVQQFPQDTVNQIIDQNFLDFSGTCEYDQRYNYDDGLYVGKEDVWTNCGDTSAELHNIVARPDDKSYVVLVQLTLLNEADFDAGVHISETFKVEGDV